MLYDPDIDYIYLFLEVAYGILVSEGEEVQHAVVDMVVLQVVHEMCAITLKKEIYMVKFQNCTAP